MVGAGAGAGDGAGAPDGPDGPAGPAGPGTGSGAAQPGTKAKAIIAARINAPSSLSKSLRFISPPIKISVGEPKYLIHFLCYHLHLLQWALPLSPITPRATVTGGVRALIKLVEEDYYSPAP